MNDGCMNLPPDGVVRRGLGRGGGVTRPEPIRTRYVPNVRIRLRPHSRQCLLLNEIREFLHRSTAKPEPGMSVAIRSGRQGSSHGEASQMRGSQEQKDHRLPPHSNQWDDAERCTYVARRGVGRGAPAKEKRTVLGPPPEPRAMLGSR